VLAFGNVLRDLYLSESIVSRAWTWHEAADIRVFHPLPDVPRQGDVIWIGNWADEERTEELTEFLIGPIKTRRNASDPQSTHLRPSRRGIRDGARMRSRHNPHRRMNYEPLRIVILGLSITSSWGNGHATTFRGSPAPMG
jgi:spore maturation protein CgeB